MYLESEKAREYSSDEKQFALFKQENSFNSIDRDKIKEHWLKKCTKLKRPLIREYWRINQDKNFYGKMDDKKKAFIPRSATHKTNRRSQKLSERDILKILTSLEDETQQARQLAKSVVLREQIKYAKLCLQFGVLPPDNFKKLDKLIENLKKFRDEISSQQENNVQSMKP